MKRISQKELINLLNENWRGSEFVSIITETEPKMRKTDNPYFNDVVKHKEYTVNIGYSYKNAVNNRREKEGNDRNFESEQRKWGQRVPKTPFVEHKGNYYLDTRILRSGDEAYFDKEGNEISKKDLEPFMYKSKSSRQGTENPVIVRNFKLSSIVIVKIRGKEYEVV